MDSEMMNPFPQYTSSETHTLTNNAPKEKVALTAMNMKAENEALAKQYQINLQTKSAKAETRAIVAERQLQKVIRHMYNYGSCDICPVIGCDDAGSDGVCIERIKEWAAQKDGGV